MRELFNPRSSGIDLRLWVNYFDIFGLDYELRGAKIFASTTDLARAERILLANGFKFRRRTIVCRLPSSFFEHVCGRVLTLRRQYLAKRFLGTRFKRGCILFNLLRGSLGYFESSCHRVGVSTCRYIMDYYSGVPMSWVIRLVIWNHISALELS